MVPSTGKNSKISQKFPSDKNKRPLKSGVRGQKELPKKTGGIGGKANKRRNKVMT